MLNWMKKAAVAAAIAIASSTIVAPPAGAIAGGRVNNADSLALLILGGSQCSGTVIAPEWVVTAKHCVHQGNSAILPQRGGVTPQERFGVDSPGSSDKRHPHAISNLAFAAAGAGNCCGLGR